MVINAQRQTSKYAQMSQAIRQISQLAHTIHKQFGLKQGLDFKVNWNGVNGALNLNIES